MLALVYILPARLLTRRENIKNLLKMLSCPQSVQLIFCR
ncbi:hypothetical protein EaACW_2930 [Erwinia amylovora ACW56400]|uniref:Uncharacterized protein n=3 Tax=Erwinia amylovora TaxID=552 RepID=A0A831ERY2_ERWAM|nr:hypothetical protein EaACW_2930 [Erwinia amylovora ACW56400]CBA22635.1 hypothetical protein predicted by Glimmer/Critica [Erwinia amylovora CFBP1430]CBX81788.1 hypothetical protein predicted by Glimmer/Critica [Erwinia amylovora ATCC BAA-2158]CCO79772.1 hypothetical protein BN432_2993 [Erwinia amylovora Ea356]CCO83575.1 hypothetical protein BN433_3018 [Erwinia amylovora Ea266]CCO87335.1 hypothetical protein BN434_2965 [Erwinia amylovora CFBP 2585]CCO91131.1 hypothetical protein BN435_2979 